MTRTQTMHHLVRKAKGRALEAKGGARGDRWTQWRGRLLRAGGEARAAAGRLGRRLHHVAHR